MLGQHLNGDETFVLVAETNRARVSRLWLQGPSKGTMDVFVDGLPALPDGVTRADDGGFWIAGVAKTTPLLKALGPYPLLRTLASHVVQKLFPLVAKPFGAALKVDANGTPDDALFDPDGDKVASVSCAVQRGNLLYLGNLHGNFVSVVDLAAQQP